MDSLRVGSLVAEKSGDPRLPARIIDFTGYEKDIVFFNEHQKRFKEYQSQLKLFPV